MSYITGLICFILGFIILFLIQGLTSGVKSKKKIETEKKMSKWNKENKYKDNDLWFK